MSKKSRKRSRQGGNPTVEHFWNTLESGTWLPCWLHKKQAKCHGKQSTSTLKEVASEPVQEIESLGESVSEAVAEPIEEVATAMGGRKKHTKKHTKKYRKKHTKKYRKKHTKKHMKKHMKK